MRTGSPVSMSGLSAEDQKLLLREQHTPLNFISRRKTEKKRHGSLDLKVEENDDCVITRAVSCREFEGAPTE